MSRDAWESYGASWTRKLKGANRSPQTIRSYLESLRIFAAWAREHELDEPARVTFVEVEEFLGAEAERGMSSSTVHRHYRQLRVFFGWLVRIEELAVSPMAKVEAPKVGETIKIVPPDEDLRALMKITRGKGFTDRRDAAIIRLLFDTGIRRGECAALKLADLDLDTGRMLVHGKGNRERIVALSPKTVEAIDAYLRARGRHKDSRLDALWLAGTPHRGPLGYDGIRLLLSRRCRQAGVESISAHQLRHAAVDAAFTAGYREHEAMDVFGWTSDAMPKHYAKANRVRRALDTADRLRTGDRI